jgi:putative DNA primase/helicase
MTAAPALSSRRDDLSAVRNALAGQMRELAAELLGKPTSADRNTLRFGRKGSLSVEVGGPRRGSWFDHEAGVGGGAIDLIMRSRGVAFPDALTWARQWLGADVRTVAQVDHQRIAEEEAADEAERVAFARRLWNEARPLGGTLAARYLTGPRALPSEAVDMLERADAARFHPSHRAKPDSRQTHPALLFAATNAAGELTAVQAVRLNPRTGTKINGAPAKLTAGSLKARGGAVRLPGEGPLIIVEGPEDGATAWIATGRPVLVALGGFAKIAPHLPTSAPLTIARDGDAEGSRADLALSQACDQLVAGGARVLVTPTPKGDDLNGILQRDGLAAVAALILRARPWGQPEPPPPANDPRPPPSARRTFPQAPAHFSAAPLSAADAGERLRSAIEGWLGRALAWVDGETPPQMGIRGAAGLGKTRRVVMALAGRAGIEHRNIEIYVSSHALATEWAIALCEHAPHLRVQVIRGREFEDLDGTMCERAPAARAVAQAGGNVSHHLCRREFEDGTVEECPFLSGCRYLAQFQDRSPAVRIFAHEYLCLPRQPGIPSPDLVVIDERFWHVAVQSRSMGLDRLTAARKLRLFKMRREDPGAVADLLAVAAKVRDALLSERPLLAALREAGVTAAMLKDAARTEFGGADELPVTPALDDDTIMSRLAAAERSDATKLHRLWRVSETEIVLDREQAHGIELRRDEPRPGTGERQDRVHIHWRKPVRIAGRPVLVIDADLDVDLARSFLPHLEAVHLPVERRVTIHQVVDTPATKRRLLRVQDEDETVSRDLLNVAAMIEGEAGAGRKTLVVATKAVADRVRGLAGHLPGVDVAWFGAVRGIDRWKDHDTVIVIGREQPPPQAIEALARAVHFDRPAPLRFLEPDETGNRIMPNAVRGYRLRDGGEVGAAVAIHPDPDVQRLLEQVRECESAQALDRLRLVHAETPKNVFILSNLVLDVTVDRITTWSDLVADPIRRMVVAGAVPLSPRDMATAYPQVFPSRYAAEKAVQRRSERVMQTSKTSDISIKIISIRECPRFRRSAYRIAGRRGPWQELLYDPDRIDPAEWIAEHIGPLAELRSIAPEPEPEDVPRPVAPAPPSPPLVVIEADGRRWAGRDRRSPALELVPGPEPRLDPRVVFGPPVRPGYGVPPPPWLRLPAIARQAVPA